MLVSFEWILLLITDSIKFDRPVVTAQTYWRECSRNMILDSLQRNTSWKVFVSKCFDLTIPGKIASLFSARWCKESVVLRILSGIVPLLSRGRDSRWRPKALWRRPGCCAPPTRGSELVSREDWDQTLMTCVEYLKHSTCFREIALSDLACAAHYNRIMDEVTSDGQDSHHTLGTICWYAPVRKF